MRTVKRPRRYLARHWIVLLRPLFRYSAPRDAYVLRAIGGSLGPVLRVDRRDAGRSTRVDRRRAARFDGVDRRHRVA